MKKKNEYKFTIGLNQFDPSHRKVAKILNRMGRRMGQFIVNAVLKYMEEDTVSSELSSVEVDSYDTINEDEKGDILGVLNSFRE